MKIIPREEIPNYSFLGGIVSPDVIFDCLHFYAAGGVDGEIVQLHFDTNDEAKSAEKILKNLGADSIARIEVENTKLIVWPKWLHESPLRDPSRKYKIAYKLLSALSALGELYYNDITGEIYLDDFADAEIVRKLVESHGQKVYVTADPDREYTTLSVVDFVTREPQK